MLDENMERIQRLLAFVSNDLATVSGWEADNPRPNQKELIKFARTYAASTYKALSEYPGGPQTIRRDMAALFGYMSALTPVLMEFLTLPWPVCLNQDEPEPQPEDIDILAILRSHRV